MGRLHLQQFVDGVVGNSSSGIIEAPSFKIGTIDIGDRQSGRIKADSVINAEPTSASIQAALINLYETNFQNRLKTLHNPFGDGGASKEIIRVIKQVNLLTILKKEFHDL
jgi:GDP/UDP-N,N'-diacetylbacillosamine 2-epimerase (hydrolysing)